MIAVYAQNGFHEEALVVFEEMQRTDVAPYGLTFASVFPALASSASLEVGVDIHRNIIRSGFHSNVVVTNVLIDMYAECGNIQKARVVFDKMRQRDTISWNAMITGYAQNGLHGEALNVFEGMQRSGFAPNEGTFASVVALYASSASLEECVHIHRKLIKNGFDCDVVIVNALIDMYAKFGNVQKARVLFDKMQQRDTISWTAMITGYAQNGLHKEALNVFERMQRNGVVPNECTFASLVALCASSASLEECVNIHRKSIKNGFHCDVVIVNALIDMYALFGNMHKASETPILWNALITGYAQNGFLDETVKLFKEIPRRDTILWTAMITAYAQNGHGLEALECFQKMQLRGCRPDSITVASILAVWRFMDK